MKKLKLLSLTLFSFLSFHARAELSLDIKISKRNGDKTFQIIQNMKANFNQDIILNHSELKEKIVLNFKKFKNISVNGSKINPIQVDLKTLDNKQNQVGKVKTVTSFYRGEAEFSGESSGEVWSVNLNFKEI